jgi:hypothetical protein
VGLVRSVGEVPLSIEHGSALQTQSPEGDKVWTLAIRSFGAFGIRLHFSNFDVGEGSVAVFARRDEADVIVRGPYTGKGPQDSGDFWTASLPGETVFIEVSGTDEPGFEVAEFLHLDKDLAGPVPLAPLTCHLDVMCHSSSVDSAVRDATGQMNYVKDGSGFACTGTILSDLDGDTFMPYFITARHCISTQTVTDTLEVVWLWQKDSCGGSLPDYNTLPRSDGGTLLHTNSGNDMTFMRLNGGIPGGTAAGWTTGHPSSAYGVHHPGGDWKRATFLSDVGFCPGCEFCGSGANYDHYDMDDGVIEGGSSGSGVFNSSGQLAGQLKGHCCLYASCSGEEVSCGNADEMTAFYGEFEETYPIIERWLVLGGTIHVDGSYVGTELGTPSQPFDTVTEAYDLAWDGARIKIEAGSYPETLTMSKEVALLANGGTVIIGP